MLIRVGDLLKNVECTLRSKVAGDDNIPRFVLALAYRDV